jgi:DNA invertase Pin-like site-specific DNA recombinase
MLPAPSLFPLPSKERRPHVIAGVYARKTNRLKKGKRRPSEQEQVQSSVKVQIERAREFAERQGWTFDERFAWYDDGVSGELFGEERPVFQKMLNYIFHERPGQRHGRLDVLILSEESRFGREQTETMYWLKRVISDAKVRVICWGDSPERGREVRMDSAMTKLVQGFRSARDEMEVELVSQRVTNTMTSKFEGGDVVSRPLYGYDKKGKVVEREAKIVRRVFKQRTEGGERSGYYAIARDLEADGVKSPAAGKVYKQGRKASGLWSPSQIGAMLHNETYRGVQRWQLASGKVLTRDCARIVDEALWKKAQVENERARDRTWKDKHGRRLKARPGTSKWLLSPLLMCSTCGGSMHVRKGKDGDAYYFCTTRHLLGRKGCSNARTLDMNVADTVFLALFEEALTGQIVLDVIRERLKAIKREKVDPGPIKRQIAKLTAENGRLVEQLINTPSLASEINARAAKNKALIEHLQGQLIGGELAGKKFDVAAFRREMTEVLDDWRAHLKPGTAQQVMRKILQQRIEVEPPPLGAQRGWAFNLTLDYRKLIEEIWGVELTAALREAGMQKSAEWFQDNFKAYAGKLTNAGLKRLADLGLNLSMRPVATGTKTVRKGCPSPCSGRSSATCTTRPRRAPRRSAVPRDARPRAARRRCPSRAPRRATCR